MGLIETRISQSIDTKYKILEDKEIIKKIQYSSDIIKNSLEKGGKVLLCGNGGSASDAIHIASEFVGRFQKERKPLPAIALNADVATMTSIANDYGYQDVFSRSVDGLMNGNDVLIGISTSGNSENVFQAFIKAKEKGGKTIALLGKDGGKINNIVDVAIVVPSSVTARIQENHIMIGHIICELVEE